MVLSSLRVTQVEGFDGIGDGTRLPIDIVKNAFVCCRTVDPDFNLFGMVGQQIQSRTFATKLRATDYGECDRITPFRLAAGSQRRSNA